MQTNNTFATTRLLDDCGLDPNSNFFKQLQDLLHTDSAPTNSTIPLIPALTTPPTLPILNLQDVIAASKSHPETERSPSPIPEVPEPATGLSDLFRQLYAPSGKWKWTSGHNILDEESRFLSAGAMCSTYYKKGKVAGRQLSYICKSWKTNKEWDKAFYSELALYKKQLRPLQGQCVPNIIGVFSAPSALNVAMEPPHSSFWIEASTDMPLSLKERCLDAFVNIHSRGVFHGDIELRHMLIGGDAQVTIIDFQESAALEPNAKVFLRPATPGDLRREIRKVKVKLDYPGSRMYEKEKRERCLRRNKHNTDEASRAFLNPSYTPELEDETEDDALNPPVLDAQEWQDWIAAPSLPRVFIVPGQTLQQQTGAYHAFLASLKPRCQVSVPLSGSSDDKPNGDQMMQTENSKHSIQDTKPKLEDLPPIVPPESSRSQLPSNPPPTLYLPEMSKQSKQSGHPNLVDSFPPFPPFPLPPRRSGSHIRSPPAHHNSPQSSPGIFDRLALLRVLSDLPPQTSSDLFPSQARQLLGAELSRVGRIVRKRSGSFESHCDDDRPTKRVRLDDEAPESSSSFIVVEDRDHVSTTSISSPSTSPGEVTGNLPLHTSVSNSSTSSAGLEDKCLGLGKYDWLPNLRYPSLPRAINEEDRRSWARVAMENLAQCALQQLPHPDLIKLYPDHPRWVDPDVQVFLGRLQRSEKELAWAAIQNPEKKVPGPRHPRSLGNLKRSLWEIQHDLECTAPETRIQKRRRVLEEGDDIGSSDVSDATGGPASSRRVRFAVDEQNTSTSAAVPTSLCFVKSDMGETGQKSASRDPSLRSWYQKPIGFVTRVFSWT
ncbi:hypothetical protein BDP27DRAFT_1295571 [Rhodocollybia butyracea]|uniref:Protein kinase domain-containing protein n=1 Tax=Rhodocollybia butyracea TaxID=206335 RepID=A0A9P5PLI1_9AGAR|nr:hypothetical protein BDP27DRAFT_1295571 [Rhodocollybia butyracea]